jgi:integrase
MRVGQFTYKVIRSSYVDKEGLSPLYLQCFQNKRRMRIPLGILVPPGDWDAATQTVKGKGQINNDVNLLVDEAKARANDILVKFRLKSYTPTLEEFRKGFENPLNTGDFLASYEYHLNARKALLEHSTWKQQKSTLDKLRRYNAVVMIHDIDGQWVNQWRAWMKNSLGNKPSTIGTALKNLKTYLHLARDVDGAELRLNRKDLKRVDWRTERTFLLEEELRTLHEYYTSQWCLPTHRRVLQVFLFGCFTGLRHSDLRSINRTNFVGEHLVFSAQKTKSSGKINSIKLTRRALAYTNDTGPIFEKVYSIQPGNKYLQEVAKQCRIKKHLSWHVARHTFATYFLTLGGSVEVLQQLLGHSNVKETMKYVHVIDRRKDFEMDRFDL